MKRTALLQRSRLKRTAFRVRPRDGAEPRTRLKPMSAKRKALLPERTALLLGLKAWVDYRCEFCGRYGQLDGHETRKPRSRYWLNPEYVVMLCRFHHEMAEAPYAKGRLEIPGTRRTGWGFALVYAASKHVRQADALRNARHGNEPVATYGRRAGA